MSSRSSDDRRRQHDVGVARGRGPERLVHDDRVRRAPTRARSRREVLVVMERVAARPVDELDVGIGQRLPS